MLEKAYKIYCKFISDETQVGGKTWKERKAEVLGSEGYKDLEWYKDLSEYDTSILELLKEKQIELGAKKSL